MTVPVGHVIANISVNGSPSKEHPVDFELRQEWGKHDLYFLRLVVPKGQKANTLKAWPDGAAIAIQWGRNPGAGITTWYGYINHHTVDTSDDMAGQNVQITYALIGTSKVLNGDLNRTWVKYTPTAIAQKIARDNSLRCVVTSISWTLPYEVQAHESDFEFLNRIADKVGFRFWVSGGTLYFIDPVVLLAGKTTNATPTYSIDHAAYIQDTATNFQIHQGDSLPGAFSEMSRDLYGLDHNTHKVFKVTASGSSGSQGSIVNTARHTTSQQEAKKLQNAAQGLSQFWITATVDVFGCVLLYPGKAINISGKAVPNKNSAAWIVTSATHVGRLSGSPDATKDSYITRLTVVTNVKQVIPKIKGVHQITPEMIQCNLSGGTWKAASLNVVIEGVF
jgi:late control gene D protein (GPD)